MSDELEQCPCCPATKCKMDEPCLGCETYGEWLNTRVSNREDWDEKKFYKIINTIPCAGSNYAPASRISYVGDIYKAISKYFNPPKSLSVDEILKIIDKYENHCGMYGSVPSAVYACNFKGLAIDIHKAINGD